MASIRYRPVSTRRPVEGEEVFGMPMFLAVREKSFGETDMWSALASNTGLFQTCSPHHEWNAAVSERRVILSNMSSSASSVGWRDRSDKRLLHECKCVGGLTGAPRVQLQAKSILAARALLEKCVLAILS